LDLWEALLCITNVLLVHLEGGKAAHRDKLCASVQILISPAKYLSVWTQDICTDFVKVEGNFHTLNYFDGSGIICWGVSLSVLGLELHLKYCFPVNLVGSEFCNPPEPVQPFLLNWDSKKERKLFSLPLHTPS